MSRGRFRLPDIHVGARVVDIGPALALAAFLVFVTPVAARATTGARPLDGLGFVLVGVSALPLTLWRRSLVVAFSGSLAFAGLYLAMGYPTGPVVLAPLAGLLAVLVRERATVRALAVASGGIGLPLAQGVGSGWTWGLVLFGLAWLAVAGLFAGAVRARRGYLAEVDAHASWAARTREEEERRRAAEERLRLARDMHDAIGHSLAVISFQAGVAEHLLERSPDDVRHALGAIRTVSKQALDELRTELGQLRTEGAAASAPATGLEMLPELIGTMRDAGMAASLEMDGITSTVPAVVGSAAYRIVQESLTNIARHAGAGAEARVHLIASASALVVQIVDTGRGVADTEPDGNGLRGMRERAAALGGRFEAGNHPDGGFRVSAWLPCHPA